MSKTITLRVDDNTYSIIKNAASGQRRTISNFLEYATMNYLSGESYITDKEMEEIENDQDLVASLKKSISDVNLGKYKIVQ